MRLKKSDISCEQCSGTTISCCTEWIVFERLSFCSPDCRIEYQVSMRRRKMTTIAGKRNNPARMNPSKVRGAA